MTAGRLLTIFIIFCFVTTAWFLLGFSVTQRTHSGYTKIGKEVQHLWGSPHIQKAPAVNLLVSENAVKTELESSNIDLGINLSHRRKGLLWYSTYDVDFDGSYTFLNPFNEPVTARVTFDFPSSQTIYDDFEYMVETVEVIPKGNLGGVMKSLGEQDPNQSLKPLDVLTPTMQPLEGLKDQITLITFFEIKSMKWLVFLLCKSLISVRRRFSDPGGTWP